MQIQMLLLVSISILIFLTLQGENNDSLFLSLLVPISLLATPTIEKIPRNSINLFFSFTCIFFTSLLIILWLCFFTIRFSFQGFIFDFLSKIQPLFIYGSDFKIVFAIFISVSWIFFLINLTKNANKSNNSKKKSNSPKNITGELIRLKKLYDDGTIDKKEFNIAKKKLLS